MTNPDSTVEHAPDETSDTPQRPHRASSWRAVAFLFGGAILTAALALLLGLVPGLFRDLGAGGATVPSIAGLLLAGAVTFFLAVGGIVALFHALELTDAAHPLGLPEGTVHALIALTLIFLFFVMAVFLYLDVSSTTTDRWVTDVSAADVEELRVSGTLVAQVARPQAPQAVETSRPGETPAATPSAADLRYDVLLSSPRPSNQVGEEMARQLITSLGTLIAAIAAFYFGARSMGGENKAPGSGRG